MERRGKTLVRSKHSPESFWRFLFDNDLGRESDLPNGELPDEVRFVQGACFGVTREAILRRPREWWVRALEYFEELNERDPEEGHYMERFWYAILSDDAIGSK
jgi:hypothetical protein